MGRQGLDDRQPFQQSLEPGGQGQEARRNKVRYKPQALRLNVRHRATSQDGQDLAQGHEPLRPRVLGNSPHEDRPVRVVWVVVPDDDPAARPGHPNHFPDHGRDPAGFGDVVEEGHTQGQVEGAVKPGQVRGVGGDGPAGPPPHEPPQHAQGKVSAPDLVAGIGQGPGQPAGAAADVENLAGGKQAPDEIHPLPEVVADGRCREGGIVAVGDPVVMFGLRGIRGTRQQHRNPAVHGKLPAARLADQGFIARQLTGPAAGTPESWQAGGGSFQAAWGHVTINARYGIAPGNSRLSVEGAGTAAQVVEAFALTKRFADFWALQGISLKVGPGEILALLGPNGAGKTTTIRILAAVLRPTSGRATVCGRDVVTDGPAVRSLVGVLTEFPGLYDRMSTRSYLEFFGELHRVPGPVLRRRVSDLLDHFGLGEVAERRLGTLSKGVRQKVALIRALVHDPRVLFLDEPTSALDPAGARQVRQFIAGLRRSDRTIILCTHNLAEAEFLADRIAVIVRGRILADGRPDELKRRFAGPPLFELRFTGPLEAAREALNGDARVVDLGPNYIRYQLEDPACNPRLVGRLVGLGVGVLSLTEVSPTLEEVYLRIVGGEGSS